MTDEDVNKLRTVIKEEVTSIFKEEINTALQPVSEELANLMVEVKGKVIPSLDELKESVKHFEDTSENHGNNTDRIDKRLTTVEVKLGIQPPPELQLIR